MSHLEQILRNLLGNIAFDQALVNNDIKIKPISSEGANYTSQLFLATITSENADDLHLFAKVAALGDKMRAEMPFAVFEAEQKMYTKIAKVYQQLEDKNNVPDEHRLKMSKFYGCNPVVKEETIVLEDLTAQGYSVYSRFKSINWQYASKAVEELAKLHALSYAYKQECPEEFDSLIKELTVDWQSTSDLKQDFFEGVIQAGITAMKEENRERVKEFIAQLNFADKFKEYFEASHNTALVHRDFRVSNLMHKINSDGTIDMRVIDYQTIQGGSPVIDLLYFIFTGSDEEFRKQHYEQLLDHYYTHLSTSMQRLGLEPEKIYPRNTYELELQQKLPYSFPLALFTLPLVTVDAKNAPKVDETLDIESFKIENPSDLFTERLNGIVNDFIRWNLL